MTSELIDWSFATVPPGPVKAAGYLGGMHYLNAGKGWTPALCQEWADAGLLRVALDEGDGHNDVLAGHNRGFTRGQAARTAMAWAGFPPGCVAYGATDFDILGGQLAIALDFYGGFAQGLGAYLPGAYGSSKLLDYVCGNRPSVFGMQADAWSHGIVSVHARILQRLGRDLGPIAGVADSSYDVDLITPLGKVQGIGAWGQPLNPIGQGVEVDQAQADRIELRLIDLQNRAQRIELRTIDLQNVAHAGAAKSGITPPPPVGPSPTAVPVDPNVIPS